MSTIRSAVPASRLAAALSGLAVSGLAAALSGLAAAGLAACAVLAVPPGVSAQAAGTRAAGERHAEGEVRGIVVEEATGRAISGAMVVLEPDAGDADANGPDASARVHRVVTDETGRYRIEGLAPGKYRLEVSRLGYGARELWLELPSEWRIRRSLGLEVAPVVLEPLLMTLAGPPPRWPSVPPGRAVAVASLSSAMPRRPTLDARALTPEQIEEVATLGEPDLFRALQRLPGVSGQGDYSASPWTRGAPWGFTQVMLDGLPLYDPLHLGGAGTAVAVEGLEAAYFLPGARPASLSEGAAGTIHLVSRTAGPERRTRIAVSPVSFRVHSEDRVAGDRVGLSVTGRRSWWDIVGPEFLRGGSTDPFDYHFADALGRLDVRLGPVGTLELGGFWEQDRVDGDVSDLVSRSEGRWGTRLGWIAAERSFGSIGVRASAGRSDYSLETRPLPWAAFLSPEGVPTFDLVSTDLSRRVLRVEAGGEVEVAPIEWEAGLEKIHEGLEQLGSEAWDREAPGSDRPLETDRGRAWMEGRVRLGSVDLSLGAALDLVGDVPLPGSPLRPSLGARWAATDGLTLELARSRNRQFSYPLASAGRGFGPALGAGHVWILANPDQPPLTSDVWTLGLEVRPGRRLTGQVTAWKRRSSGLWTTGVSTLIDGGLRPVSAEGEPGRERAEGVELLIRREGEGVTGEVSYTWTRASIVGAAGTSWFSPADRRHSFDARVGSALWRGIRGTAFLRVESGWPYSFGPWVCDDGDQECAATIPPDLPEAYDFRRSPAYASLDILLSWKSRGDSVTWGVFASLRNVLRQDNASAYRSDSCFGSELISVVCERSVGAGTFSPGLTGSTPSIGVTVEF